MTASGYLLTLEKLTELVCSLAFLSGFFVPLVTVVLFPVTLNILMNHLFIAAEGLQVAILLMVGNLFLAYFYVERYWTMLKAK